MKRILYMKDITDIDPGIDTLAACCPTVEEIAAVKASFENEPNIDKY